jgi:hypothetical protein
MTNFRLAALAGAVLAGALIGVSAPAQADTTQASNDLQHSVRPLESLGNMATSTNNHAIDTLWRGHDSH